MANSPSASTVTIPSCTMRPLLKIRRSVTSVTHPSKTASTSVRVGRRKRKARLTVGPTAPSIAFAAVRMMSNVAASTAPCTQPGAPS